MMATHGRVITALVIGWTATSAVAADEKAPSPQPSAAAKYAETATKRATPIVADLKLSDPAKSARVRKIVEAHYIGINDIHTERDAAVKAAGADKPAADAARQKAEPAVKVVHDQFVKDLSAELTTEQVEAVKDGMTYKVVPITYRVYLEQLPEATDEQKAKILGWLKEGREVALDAGSSEAKHAAFGKFKGRITNYLAKEGYDMKKAEAAWLERKKKGEAAKKSDDASKQPK
jgi:hypothetical protein